MLFLCVSLNETQTYNTVDISRYLFYLFSAIKKLLDVNQSTAVCFWTFNTFFFFSYKFVSLKFVKFKISERLCWASCRAFRRLALFWCSRAKELLQFSMHLHRNRLYVSHWWKRIDLVASRWYCRTLCSFQTFLDCLRHRVRNDPFKHQNLSCIHVYQI